jgi:hypothetical protein
MGQRAPQQNGLLDFRNGSNAVFPFLALMLTDKKIAPHIPVIDKSKREDGTLRAVRDPLTSVLPPAQLSPGICRPCR